MAQMRLAVVGDGTGKVFEEAARPALTVAFTPTKVCEPSSPRSSPASDRICWILLVP